MYRDFIDNPIYSAGHRISCALARSLSRFEVYGQENTPEEGALLMCNHASYLDPLFLGAGFEREVHYMARSTLFIPGPIDNLLRTVNAFPVHRGSPDRAALKRTLTLVRTGKLVLIFPEGTRSHDGSLGEAAMGAAFLAYHAQDPVVPIYLQNMHHVLPRGRILPRRAKVRLYIGTPLELDALRAGRGREAYHAIGEEIMKAIGALKAQSSPSRCDRRSHLVVSRSRLRCPIVRSSSDLL